MLAMEEDLRVVAQCADLERLTEAIGSLRNSIAVFPSSISDDLSGLMDWVEHAGSKSVVIVEHGTKLDDAIAKRVEGIVQRSVAGPQLVECLRRVGAGERCVQRAEVKAMPSPDRVGARVLQRLTPKELQILSLVTRRRKEPRDRGAARDQGAGDQELSAQHL